jgi:DNA-binding transcriptional ArsR family regulator
VGRTSAQRIQSPAETLVRKKLPDLDRIIHERIRLGIVSALAANQSITFGELKGLLNTTDGNLSVHARKLEDAGYIDCDKSFEGRMPKTKYWLTPRAKSPGKVSEPHGGPDPGHARNNALR